MKMSAGAAASICLASVGLAAYEMVTCLPVSRSYCVFMSSSAFFKLAAANTTTSRGCAQLVPVGRSDALVARLTITPRSHRRPAAFDDAILLFPRKLDMSRRIERSLPLGEGF